MEEGRGRKETYPLLGELARTLVLAVAEQFNDALLIGGKSSWVMVG